MTQTPLNAFLLNVFWFFIFPNSFGQISMRSLSASILTISEFPSRVFCFFQTNGQLIESRKKPFQIYSLASWDKTLHTLKSSRLGNKSLKCFHISCLVPIKTIFVITLFVAAYWIRRVESSDSEFAFCSRFYCVHKWKRTFFP